MSTAFPILDYAFGQRALLAAAMIGLVNGYLGGYVVLRRSSLFAGALSHTLFPGIALGALVAGFSPLSALIGAGLTAFVAGIGATTISSTSRLDRDATLAILYTAAFGAGLIILKHLSVAVRIEDYLFGNILAVSNTDLWFVFGAGGLVMLLLILLQRPLLLFIFNREVAAGQGVPVLVLEYLLSALLILTMITSLQAVGAILTLGLLVTPASIIYLYADTPRTILWGGGLLGAGVSIFCLLISYRYNVQTGPAIVVALGLLFLLAWAFSPRYGLRAVLDRRRHLNAEPDKS